MPAIPNVLAVTDLHAEISTSEGIARVLNGVTLEVAEGEALGLVGESGAGKSVLAKAIINLLEAPARIMSGSIRFEGRNILACDEHELRSIRGRQIGLIVPNPHTHLNPLIPVGEQLVNVIRAHRNVPYREAWAEAERLLESVGIRDARARARALPSEFSGGMAQRAVIVMALANSPKLIVADEPSGGLDVTVQRQTLDILLDRVRAQRSALLLITRDLGIVANYCDRVAVMYAGRIIEQARVRPFFSQARHPYSLELLRLASPTYRAIKRFGKGDPAFNPVHQPSGCPFHPRCLVAEDRCRVDWPDADTLADEHVVHCHVARKIDIASSA